MSATIGTSGNALANLFERDRGVVVRHGQPDDLAAGADHLFDLSHGCAYVRRVGLGHRLDDTGRAAADLNVLNLDCFGLSHNCLGLEFKLQLVCNLKVEL